MIMTVNGPIGESDFGRAAIHEHVMVDFHEPGQPPRPYDAAEVVRVMEPYLVKLKEAGCRSFVDCTPDWLGRDPLVLKELSCRTGLHIVTNTGWYRPPMIPPAAYELSEEQISDLWVDEYGRGIGRTGVRPGFIKIALNGPAPTPEPVAVKLLRAAILASKRTGMPIVSHTVWSEGALLAADALDEAGLGLERFIWAHADSNDCPEHQAALARRGMWISLDGISEDYGLQTGMLRALAEAGLAHRALLSQDSGWYSVGEPSGGDVRPYHTLFTEFIPYAAAHGVDAALLEQVVTVNASKAMRIREANE